MSIKGVRQSEVATSRSETLRIAFEPP